MSGFTRPQNWIYHKTGQNKACIVLNIKHVASYLAAEPKSWQSHHTSETVGMIIENEKDSFRNEYLFHSAIQDSYLPRWTGFHFPA